MEELDHPATSAEIYGMLDGTRSLAVIEYHLHTLVRSGFAGLIIGPELRFDLGRGRGGDHSKCHAGQGAKAPSKLGRT
jgi:hypothetical protein